MGTDNLGWGGTLALLTGSAIVAYTAWRIHNRREELRETIELLTPTHGGFIDDLEAMAAAGLVVPVPAEESHG